MMRLRSWLSRRCWDCRLNKRLLIAGLLELMLRRLAKVVAAIIVEEARAGFKIDRRLIRLLLSKLC